MLRVDRICTDTLPARRAGKTVMEMTCRSCGHENRLSASYCGNCAQPLTGGVACLECAAHNPSQQNFCNSCGSPLAGGKRTRGISIPNRVASVVSTVSATPSSSGPEVDTLVDTSRDQGHFAHAAKLTIAIVAIAVVGSILAVTRLWGLGSTPPEIALSEETFVLVARQIEFEGWIGLSQGLLDGALTGYAYVLTFWTDLVGDDLGTTRLLSGIASLASVGVSYFLIALVFNRRVALFAVLLMAVSVWPLTYARLALPMSLLLFVEVVAFYLLFRAFHTTTDESLRRNLLVLSGALVGLSLYLDFVAIVFTAAILCLWLRFYVAGTISLRVLGERFAAFVLPALIISLPFWAITGTDASLRDDAKALLITETPRYLQSEGVMSQLRNVTGNVVNTGRALVWSTSADEFGQGGGRIVDPLTGLLVLVGLLVCLGRWRDDSYGALLVLFVVIVVGVGLTRQEGMFGRLIVAVPVAFCLAGVAAGWLLSWLKGRVPEAVILALLAVLTVGVMLYNLTTYYAHPIGKEPTLWVGSVIERPPSQHAFAGNVP